MPLPPSYRDIAEQLGRQITEGELKAGDKLPSYAELARDHGVSVTTVQSAIRLLRDRGMIEGRQGKGVFVVDRNL